MKNNETIDINPPHLNQKGDIKCVYLQTNNIMFVLFYIIYIFINIDFQNEIL